MDTRSGWRLGWFGDCDVEGVKDEQLTPFLAISLIQMKQQKEGIVVEMPEPGSKQEKVGVVMTWTFHQSVYIGGCCIL